MLQKNPVSAGSQEKIVTK